MRYLNPFLSTICIALLAAPLLAQQQTCTVNAREEKRPAKTFFVSPKGRDKNPGTEQSPFRTVQVRR